MGEMAQKISKVDHEELLKVLNMAGKEKLRWRIQHSTANGVRRPSRM